MVLNEKLTKSRKLRGLKLRGLRRNQISTPYFTPLVAPIFGRKWPISDRFLAQSGSNDHSNDVFSICVIKNGIYSKGKLISAKITAQNSEIKENFAWLTFFPLWTVKLLFVIFGRLSYTFLWDKYVT